MSIVKVMGLIMGFLGVAAVSAGGFSGHIAIIGIVLAVRQELVGQLARCT